MNNISKLGYLRICIVAGQFPKSGIVSGSPLQQYFIARELVKKGYEVHFTTVSDLGTEQIAIDDIVVHRVNSNLSLVEYFSQPWSLLKQIDADIYMNRALGYTIGTMFFTRFFGKKFIYSVASDSDCVKVDFFSLKHLTTKGRVSRIIRKVNQLGMRNANLVIAQTKHQQELLWKNFKAKSALIRNGHPIPIECGKKEKPPIVLWIAGVKRFKQPEFFIRLAQECQDIDARFVMAGKASPSYEREILYRAGKLTKLKYIGAVSFEEANMLFAKASVFVNTSTMEKDTETTEGFPNAFIQAWMRETPTVSLNVDPDDVIKKNRLGFHSRSFEQMVKDVRFLIEKKEVREEMGRNGRKYAIREHDIRKIVPKYIELIEKTINEK